MRDSERYMNMHGDEIKRLILFVGEGFAWWRINNLIDRTFVEEIILTGNITEAHADDLFEDLEKNHHYKSKKLKKLCYQPVENICPEDGEKWAVLFSEIDDNIDSIFQMQRIKPVWLFGEMSERTMSSFAIWEQFRKCSDYIQILTYQKDGDAQLLDWTKRPGCDIELSVIFPMYNVEKYLDQCIQSVTAWDADYIEFLFVNDGSPDNSREVILKYAEKDSRIHLLDKPNGGCASARQYGMERARGNYVGFIDPDDYIDESMYRKLLRAAMKGSYDISYCGYKEYYENTGEVRKIPDALGWPYNKGVTDELKIHELISYCRVAIWRGIYKMDMLKRANIHFYTEIRRFDDLPFKVETFAAAKSVIAVEEYLYYYRLSRPGQDVAADDERLYVHFPIFKHLDDSIGRKKDFRLNDWLLLCKVQTHCYALEKIKPEFVMEYARQAREDIRNTDTGSYLRTYSLVKHGLNKKSAVFYSAIVKQKKGKLKHMSSVR